MVCAYVNSDKRWRENKINSKDLDKTHFFTMYIHHQGKKKVISKRMLPIVGIFKSMTLLAIKFSILLELNDKSLPGPFEPPANNLPNRNMTALSYS